MEKNFNDLQEKINCFAKEVNQIRTSNDLCFVMLSDSCLSDISSVVRENIRMVDEQVHFDCLIHLGDVLRGNNPEKISRQLFRDEMTAYRKSIENGKVFVIQGEQDGYRDEAFCGQVVHGIMRDDMWHEDTAFMDAYERMYREGDNPYFYVDFSQYSTRLVFLCSSFYAFDAENQFFERYPSFDLKQLAWLKNVALKAEEGWNVLLFSHSMPKSRFDTGTDPFIYKGNSTEKFLNILQKAQEEQQISVICWCAGHYQQDRISEVASIYHMVMRGTDEVEAWDALVLKMEERKLYAFRFGEGENRVILY